MFYFRVNDDNTLVQLEEYEQECLEVESIPQDAILGYYRFNENSGTVEVDYERELKELKEDLLIKNGELYGKYAKTILSGYSEYEVKTWDQQVAEANYYLQHKEEEGVETHIPLLRELAKNREVEIEVLADKILLKSHAYLETVGTLLGIKQKLDQLIESVTDIANLINEEEIEAQYLNSIRK